jgi:hypothetical protein
MINPPPIGSLASTSVGFLFPVFFPSFVIRSNPRSPHLYIDYICDVNSTIARSFVHFLRYCPGWVEVLLWPSVPAGSNRLGWVGAVAEPAAE